MFERLGLRDPGQKYDSTRLLTFTTTKRRRQLVDQILRSDQLERRFGGEVRSLNNIEHMFDTLPTPTDKFKGIAAEI